MRTHQMAFISWTASPKIRDRKMEHAVKKKRKRRKKKYNSEWNLITSSSVCYCLYWICPKCFLIVRCQLYDQPKGCEKQRNREFVLSFRNICSYFVILACVCVKFILSFSLFSLLFHFFRSICAWMAKERECRQAFNRCQILSSLLWSNSNRKCVCMLFILWQ